MGTRRGRRRLAVGVAGAVLLLAGCLRTDVDVLSGDAMDGRNNGTAGSLLAQDHLVRRLQGWSVGANASATGVAAYHQDFAGGRNIVAIIPGTDLAHEYVMIGAHYDGLGSGSNCHGKTPQDDICNGATDNAAGTAIALNVAERLATWTVDPPRRSVIVAFWDAEEDGLVGSRHYVANPLVPLEDTVAYVNLDIQGANLRRSIASTTFAIGAETGGPVLVDAVQRAAAPGPLDTRMLSLVFGMGRSDHQVLFGAGVPVVFFSDSTGPCYHTVEDDLAALDRVKLAAQLETTHRLVWDLTRMDVAPVMTAAPVITYDDAVALSGVMADLREGTGEFSAEDEATIWAHGETVDQIVADGPAAFGQDDVGTLAGVALEAIDLLTTGPCDAFLPDR